MAQCEKILDSGERCSNPAVPGGRYCQTHGRISFKPVAKPADTAPLPTEPSSAKPDVPKPAPPHRPTAWEAVPSASGEAPKFPALFADGRNILVAPQGVIWLPASPEDKPTTQFKRLLRMLGFLSQSIALPGQVHLLRQGGDDGDVLLPLSPKQSERDKLSAFYDAASAAARLVDGRLFIGQGNAYVQYRDDHAPRGYDLQDFQAHEEQGQWLLAARWGSQFVNVGDFNSEPLADFCMRAALLTDVAGAMPTCVYALAPSALYTVLCRYFHAHHLQYAIASLQTGGKDWSLFEIRPRPGAATGQHVPSFIVDYLVRLPRLAVLASAHQLGQRQILVERGHRSPLHLPHIAEAFAEDGLVLLTAGNKPSLHLSPAPVFFDGDLGLRLDLQKTAPLNLKPVSDNRAKLGLPVRLRPARGPTPPIDALYLDAQGVAWLRQILYRLPGAAFSGYALCLGEGGAVLIGESRPIAGIPFGVPLRRIAEGELFIPLRSAFVPDLPWDLLRLALDIQDQTYTFLIDGTRLDLPTACFAPLSRLLMADTRWPRTEFVLKAASALPELHWTAPPAPPKPAHDESKPGLWQKLLSGKPRQPIEQPQATALPQTGADPQALWLEQAKAREQDSDFLAAAVCYSVLNDAINAARCYREALTAILPQQTR